MTLINLIAKATFLYKLSQTDKNKIINDVYKKNTFRLHKHTLSEGSNAGQIV